MQNLKGMSKNMKAPITIEEIFTRGHEHLIFNYKDMDVSIWKVDNNYYMVDYDKKYIYPFDYKDLVAIHALLYNHSLKY